MRRAVLFAVVAVLCLAGESSAGPVRRWVENRPGWLVPRRQPAPVLWYAPVVPQFPVVPAPGLDIGSEPLRFAPAVQPGVVVGTSPVQGCPGGQCPVRR